MKRKILEKLLDKVKYDIEKLEKVKLTNPFYGKEIYFFNGCVKPIVDRNQLMGYIGAFSGNNKKLISKINYGVLNENSWLNLQDLRSDENLEKLSALIGLPEGKRNKIPNTYIIPESILFYRVYEFIKNDQVKLNQFNRVDFKEVNINEFQGY